MRGSLFCNQTLYTFSQLVWKHLREQFEQVALEMSSGLLSSLFIPQQYGMVRGMKLFTVEIAHIY